MRQRSGSPSVRASLGRQPYPASGAAGSEPDHLAAGLDAAPGDHADGASGAWLAARMTGTRAHAGTVALVALVGTQLGQTLGLGWRDPVVAVAGLGSAAAQAAIVQTPGVSGLVGCRPLGPLVWAQALTAAGLATTAAVVLPGLLTPRHAPRTDRRGAAGRPPSPECRRLLRRALAWRPDGAIRGGEAAVLVVRGLAARPRGAIPQGRKLHAATR
jgi:hypothetical protein